MGEVPGAGAQPANQGDYQPRHAAGPGRMSYFAMLELKRAAAEGPREWEVSFLEAGLGERALLLVAESESGKPAPSPQVERPTIKGREGEFLDELFRSRQSGESAAQSESSSAPESEQKQVDPDLLMFAPKYTPKPKSEEPEADKKPEAVDKAEPKSPDESAGEKPEKPEESETDDQDDLNLSDQPAQEEPEVGKKPEEPEESKKPEAPGQPTDESEGRLDDIFPLTPQAQVHKIQPAKPTGFFERLKRGWLAAGAAIGGYFTHPEKGRRRQVAAALIGSAALVGAAWIWGEVIDRGSPPDLPPPEPSPPAEIPPPETPAPDKPGEPLHPEPSEPPEKPGKPPGKPDYDPPGHAHEPGESGCGSAESHDCASDDSGGGSGNHPYKSITWDADYSHLPGPRGNDGQPFEWTILSELASPAEATPELLSMIETARARGVQVETWGDICSDYWGITSVTVENPDGTAQTYYDAPGKLAALRCYGI